MRAVLASILVIVGYCSSSYGRSIAPSDDPFVWSNELVWDSTNNISLILNYKENGDFTATLRLGSWSDDYAEQMPVLAASLWTNIFTDFFYAKYGVGLNMKLVNAVVTGDTNGDLKYLLKNMVVIVTDELALGGSLQGEKFNINTFGVNIHSFGLNTQDDPEEWRNSILWNKKKPVSFSLKYKSADGDLRTGDVSGGLTLGYSKDWLPSAAVAFSNKLENIRAGDWVSALRLTAGLHHNEIQGVVVANKSELTYLLNANVKNDGGSVGGLIQGSKATLTNGGLTAELFGTLASVLVNEKLDNLKEVTINL